MPWGLKTELPTALPSPLKQTQSLPENVSLPFPLCFAESRTMPSPRAPESRTALTSSAWWLCLKCVPPIPFYFWRSLFYHHHLKSGSLCCFSRMQRKSLKAWLFWGPTPPILSNDPGFAPYSWTARKIRQSYSITKQLLHFQASA